MANVKLIENLKLNGIELYFDTIPEVKIREELKNNGFRWNRSKSCWYAKKTDKTVSVARVITGSDFETAEEKENKIKKDETINLDNLGANTPCLFGAELAKAIREQLKIRGVKGVTVKCNRGGYTTSITVTVKATSEDFSSIEEYSLRYPKSLFSCELSSRDKYINGHYYSIEEYEALPEQEQETLYIDYIKYQISRESFSGYHRERNSNKGFSMKFYEKLNSIFMIANQWNYDNSDIMTDYHDVGYYLDIDIKKPEDFEPRQEMTEEEREAYRIEEETKERERVEKLEAYKREMEEAERQRKEYEKKQTEDFSKINANIIIIDLPENEQIYIKNIIGGCGKACNLEDLDEQITDCPHFQDALITRKLIFSNEGTYKTFTNYLLSDFDFFENKGGTASEDVRLENVKNIYSLNESQRESVKFFCNDCIAVYVNNDLKLVIDPQGYSYARYTYITTEETEILKASEELERQRKESETKTPFYFPESVEIQSEKLCIGQEITVYQSDGWILNNIYGGSGIITNIDLNGSYAQYKGVTITLGNGKKERRVFIRNGHDCLIYSGIKPTLPEKLTKEPISASMYKLYNSNEIFPLILDYYSEKPLIDTIQR